MLQQTRVAAAIPYYGKFLLQYPRVKDLARARLEDVLALWAGLGYYSRARNLHRAARAVAARGGFPETHDEIRALAGVGDYTAAAVASIAFGLPYAAVDGNVIRVMARVLGEDGDVGSARVRSRLKQSAQELLDRKRPGEFNQALMELGATVCRPRSPDCPRCPWSDWCAARKSGRQENLPFKRKARAKVTEEKTVLVVRRNQSLLLWRRPARDRALGGFWELPEPAQVPDVRLGKQIGMFRHTITYHEYSIRVVEGQRAGKLPRGFAWVSQARLGAIPVSTVVRKALGLR